MGRRDILEERRGRNEEARVRGMREESLGQVPADGADDLLQGVSEEEWPVRPVSVDREAPPQADQEGPHPQAEGHEEKEAR